MRIKQSLSITIFALLLCSILSGCKEEMSVPMPQLGTSPPRTALPVYALAVHPLHNPALLTHSYQPLIEYLNRHLNGARLTLEASRDYANFEEKYRARTPEFILPNPWQTLQAMPVGYRVIAMAGEPEDFRGIFVVRRDNRMTRPADLKGKAVSYPSPTALAACIMPQYFLYRNGLNVNVDIENHYVGSQESSIMNVYLGKTAAGATWPPPWRAFIKEHPQEAAELKVLWKTESLVNNSVMARDDLPVPVVDQLRTLLVGLAETPEGAAILAGIETARFLPASDADYEVVRHYVRVFERDVRPVEGRR